MLEALGRLAVLWDDFHKSRNDALREIQATEPRCSACRRSIWSRAAVGRSGGRGAETKPRRGREAWPPRRFLMAVRKCVDPSLGADGTAHISGLAPRSWTGCTSTSCSPGRLRGQPLRLDDEQQAFICDCMSLFPKRIRRRAGDGSAAVCGVAPPKGLRKTELAAWYGGGRTPSRRPGQVQWLEGARVPPEGAG